jgi:hypothetical protein
MSTDIVFDGDMDRIFFKQAERQEKLLEMRLA